MKFPLEKNRHFKHCQLYISNLLWIHHQTVSKQYWDLLCKWCSIPKRNRKMINCPIKNKTIAISKCQVFLFIPLYLVLNFSIYMLSLAFLNCGSWLLTFSIIVTFMLWILWPFLLKCWPVALLRCWLATYPLWSENLSCNVLSVSPMYCSLHTSHSTQ